MLSMYGVTFVLIVLGEIFSTLSNEAIPLQNERPAIAFQEFDTSSWKNLTNLSGIHTLKSLEVGDLDIACEAPYPIQWNITGVITPVDIIKVHPSTRLFSPDKFRIAAAFLFYSADSSFELAGSANIACEKVSDYNVRNEFYVFVKGNNSKSLIKPHVDTVIDSTLIPCPTTDPTTTTSLFSSHLQGRETLVQNAVYYPAEGFRREQLFNGRFVCRQGSFSVSITAVTTFQPNSGYQFSPFLENIEVFADEEIVFNCTSKSRSVELAFDDSSNITVIYSLHKDNMKSAHMKMANGTTSGKGKVSCVADGREVIRIWSYEFIEVPELYFDNFAGQLHCLTSSTPRMIQTVRCQNPLECQSFVPCFRNSTSCNFDVLNQFYSDKETHCWLWHLGKSKACTSLPYSHLNGIVQCTAKRLARQFEFFVSLDYLRYSSWQNAHERELLRMDAVPDILYTNNTAQFVCVATAFLFADSLAFEIEYTNGSRMLLYSDGVLANVTTISEENPRKIREFNIMASLDINLPIDAIGISCLVPWWNSTNVMKTSTKFETRHLIAPLIPNSDVVAKEGIILGGKNQRLSCPSTSEPLSEYYWLYKNDNNEKFANVSVTFPELKTSIGSRGEGYLEFTNPDKKYSGHYQCVAFNIVGRSTRTYTLDVSDDPGSGNFVYIGIVVLVLLLLALVLGALLIVMRRYNQARELVRSLTDGEIEEFFQGKPELLANAPANSLEVIDFLPYNEQYEIDSEDLKFDSSEQNYLGSGEFSYVVKGMIISKRTPVAIKISKPSADVALFKSLLSEVKIMLYIGHHENVIKLIGVCTSNIRDRSIFIATEICDQGSLDVFLRKGRRDFVNLMDANQQIDLKLLREDMSLSTLDLISFSCQIARGMEYLTFKSVIHADLASRNVLLTSNRVAKIADFGLSKKLYENNNYVKKSKTPLPWRWMAVESLTTLTFSTHSDIWSYGATLFEIFTLGDIPFPNEEWNKEFITRLSTGMRMGRPKFSTQEIYGKIVACWESEPDMRPSFTVLRTFFDQMLTQYQVKNPVNANQGSGSIPTPTNMERGNWGEEEYSAEPIYANSGIDILPSSPAVFYANMDPSN